MANGQERKAFIKEIAPCAQKAYKTLGKVKPSVCIAMACVESAYGTRSIMRKHNAYLGHKVGTGKTATKYWGGKFFVAGTSEEYTIGEHTAIKAAFRSFDTMEQCVFNFYELLNTYLYDKVQADADAETQMQQIKQCGYMTSSTEVNTCISIIRGNNLIQYDSETTRVINQKPKSKYPTLRKGSQGEYVEIMQNLLTAKGYILILDGDFGFNTEKALKSFQKANNLVCDGICGQQSWGALLD